jgi:predicted secreted protein
LYRLWKYFLNTPEYIYITLRKNPVGRGHIERSNTRRFVYRVSLKPYQHWLSLNLCNL